MRVRLEEVCWSRTSKGVRLAVLVGQALCLEGYPDALREGARLNVSKVTEVGGGYELPEACPV